MLSTGCFPPPSLKERKKEDYRQMSIITSRPAFHFSYWGISRLKAPPYKKFLEHKKLVFQGKGQARIRLHDLPSVYVDFCSIMQVPHWYTEGEQNTHIHTCWPLQWEVYQIHGGWAGQPQHEGTMASLSPSAAADEVTTASLSPTGGTVSAWGHNGQPLSFRPGRIRMRAQ